MARDLTPDTCPSCGRPVERGAAACSACGAPLGPAPVFTHTGLRYVLGYLPDAFAIWDRRAPRAPVERFPRTDEGWQAAWARYTSIERTFAEVPKEAPARAIQYTHSGARYLLGYGADFFGIWERASPEAPVERFPRTDEGWRAAWYRFVALEPEHTEVGLGRPGSPGSPTAPSGWAAPAPAVRRRIHGAWWTLPILFGLVGGFVAWLANKDVDPRRAGWLLVVGALSSVTALALYLSSGPG
ncbi:MAG TPA: zinc-ribbon domain-containing protein [Actinomycetota bacterium]|nr:zinc-ribbon domain-containing protein [Actinomycetota bacterium]